MKNIFRMPVDHVHYKDTIENGKKIQEIEKFISKEERHALEKCLIDEKLKYWGSLPGASNTRNWDILKEGDEILGYREGEYICLAIVGYKTRNKKLAEYSWGTTEVGSTWEYMYFFKQVTFFKIENEKINTQFGFKPGPVMGFNIISPKTSEPILAKFGSVKNLIDEVAGLPFSKEHLEKKIKQIQIASSFEAQYYLVDLGNSLKFDTYVPMNDASRTVFGKKINEIATLNYNDIEKWTVPNLLSDLKLIDVIWFEVGCRPAYMYEVVHKAKDTLHKGLERMHLVQHQFSYAKPRIVGPEEMEFVFNNDLRRFPGLKNPSFKNYEQLFEAHTASVDYNKVVNQFLAD